MMHGKKKKNKKSINIVVIDGFYFVITVHASQRDMPLKDMS
jgi:hypothetical protein